jgi:murein DD-endopeptidase MepM/ murein hydrolase activator NlpD
MADYRSLVLAWIALFSLSTQALELDGELVQGGLVFGQVPSGTVVMLDGDAVPVAADGTFVIGFDRDAPAQMTLEAGDRRRVLDIEPREYRISRVDGIAQRIMEPSEEDLRRIREESARVRKAKAHQDLRTDFDSGFKWPVTGRISGVFGSQRIYNGRPGRPHYGVDIARPTGTPVYAPADGLVTLAEPDLFYSGGTIILDHGLGLSSSFLHMSRVLVEVGQRIRQGDLIGEVGAGGRATGPHLDWRMSWRGAQVDPQRLVGDMADPGNFAGHEGGR